MVNIRTIVPRRRIAIVMANRFIYSTIDNFCFTFSETKTIRKESMKWRLTIPFESISCDVSVVWMYLELLKKDERSAVRYLRSSQRILKRRLHNLKRIPNELNDKRKWDSLSCQTHRNLFKESEGPKMLGA
jgi:hypothetical protein